MISRIRRFLAATPYIKIGEHLAVAFVSAFGLAAVATLEHAAGSHGFQLSWSFAAGVASAAAAAGYQKVRPQLLRLLGKEATRLLSVPPGATVTVLHGTAANATVTITTAGSQASKP